MSHTNSSRDTVLRHLEVLKNIPLYPKTITAGDIMRRLRGTGFEVSKRTIERNLIDLSLIFPLISDNSSMPYRWSWDPDAGAFSVPSMSPVQALTLSLARDHLTNLLPASMMATLSPYFKYADNVLLSGEGVKNMANWRNKVAIVPTSQPLISPTYSEELLETIHDALLSQRKLEIDYLPRTQKAHKSIIHPLGLVQRGAVMELVATFHTYTDIRRLVLHRIKSAKKLDTPSRKPRGFCLKDYIAQGHFGVVMGEKIRLVARFTSYVAEHLRETPLSRDQRLTDENGAVRIEATVLDTSQLRWWLLAFGDKVTVLEPASLREEFAKTAQSMNALYQDN